MKVKETIKNKYEECKEKISNMDDFTKGVVYMAIVGLVAIKINQDINDIVIAASSCDYYALGVENTLNSIGKLTKN